MLDANKPMEAIEEWQKWYQGNRSFPQSLTSVTMNSVSPITANDLVERTKEISAQKAEEYFADTITEFLGELSGKELYKAFYAAAVNNLNITEKEYNKAKQLVDMLRCNHVAP